MNWLPSFSELVASKLMFRTISPSPHTPRGTWTVVRRPAPAMYGVNPLSVHHSPVQGPDQIGAGGGFLGFRHSIGSPQGCADYLRITFSDGVSASM